MRKSLMFLSAILFAALQLFAQERTITGKVTDQKDGSPLSGATVTVKGTRLATTTDATGAFKINVPATAKALVITSVNFGTQEVTIGGLSSINVALQSEETAMSEVVVVGYGTQRKREVTGNVANVRGAALANKPVQSFDQALGGRAAGVQVTIPSGVLNSPPVIRVRGTNSISLSSYPLIVLDGVPMFTGDFSSTSAAGNVLASINPNDIESIDVAKDAAATAIYGSRAANGVLFITTKKGKQGKAKVSVDSWIGWNQVQRLPTLLDAFQYTDYKNLAMQNAGVYNANTNAFALTNGPDGKPINTNWYDYIYRTGMMHSNSMNLSGANETTSYYFSAGFTKQEGIIKRNDFKRANILMNVDHKVNKVISMGAKIQYSNEENLAAVSSGSLGDAFSTAGLGRVPLITAPNVSPYNNDGSYNFNGALIGVQGNKVGQVGFNNPVIQLDKNRTNSFMDHVIGDLYAQAKLLPGLVLKTVYGVDYIYVDNDFYYSPISGEGIGTNGSTSAIYNKNKRSVWTNTLQYDKTFAEKHNLSALAGIEEQRSTQNSYGLNRITVSDPDFTNIQGGWATPNATGLGIGENYLYSEFGRLQYNFDRKYYLSGNLRRDGASQLGTNSKYGLFWGASAGWDIDKEKFWSSAKLDRVFSSFRIRGSYGKVGNIGGLGNFQSLSTFGSGLYGGNPTVAYSQAGNPDLTWETSYKTDVGFSFGLLNDKITGDFAYYNNNVNGLLLFVPQPPSAGLPSTIPQNIGAMYNRGIEFSLGVTAIQSKNFSWNSSFNVATNKNEVTALAPGITNIIGSTGGLENPNITVVGQPISMIFVTRTAGVDPATGRRIFINSKGEQVFFQHVAPAGQSRFMFADGRVAPQVSSADAVVYKNTNPKLFGGWENTFRYKGFELNALITYQFGNYIYFGTQAGLRDQRFWNNEVGVLNHWKKGGDQTEFPRPIWGDNISNGSAFPLDINVFKGDFVKLRTLTLGYNVPKSLLDKIKVSNARFYLTGNNLFMVTPYPGPDPEVSSNGNGTTNFGVDRNTVANQRSLTIGINLGL